MQIRDGTIMRECKLFALAPYESVMITDFYSISNNEMRLQGGKRIPGRALPEAETG